jgi:hypothetical protein
MVPNTAANIGLYTPNATIGTFTTGPATTGYAGGALLPDGRVLLVPSGASKIRIYDPITNTLQDGPDTSNYGGAVLIPDGRVILVPGSNIGIYLTNTPAPVEFCLHPCFNKL